MSRASSSRGVLLWIDDEFEGLPLPDRQPWQTILSGQSDKVFRLMDLNLEVASSVQEAVEALDRLDRERRFGTYVFVVCDLRIPVQPNGASDMKHGLAMAAELRRRGYGFVFLSAKSNAARSLDRADLGAVPYYVKEPADSPWRTMPEALKQVALNEFRNHIGWVSLEDLAGRLAPGSNCSLRRVAGADSPIDAIRAGRFFPFFGSYRDFSEQCEFRVRLEPGRTFAVRSSQNHCDVFVQQCLLLMMASLLTHASEPVNLDYGEASDEGYYQSLLDQTDADHRDAVRVLRVVPELTSPELLHDRLSALMRLPGTLVLVVPSDESCDAYAEILQERGIITVGELPQDHHEGGEDREQLVRRASELVVQAWLESSDKAAAGGGWQLGSSQPELLINPIDWRVLLEASHFVKRLSDPFECLDELARALAELPDERRERILVAMESGEPLHYAELLQVGRATFLASDIGGDWRLWIERALDRWLESSWRFPHGIHQDQAEGDSAAEDDCVAPWSDACFEVLVGMLEEFRAAGGVRFEISGGRARDLSRVEHFVRALGSRRFLAEGGQVVDWEALEFLRWPHLRYPMPLSVTSRLKRAGRFLWIQPDGLDLAAALPVGRQRYRMLVDAVDQYWGVLGWGTEIVDQLPKGWSSSVGYLLDLLRGRDLAQRWEREPQRVWDALLGMLRNASPVLFIADQALRGRPLAGTKSSAVAYLSSVQGYGKIMSRIRGSRVHRLGGYLQPCWDLGCSVDSGLPLLPQLIAAGQGEDGSAAAATATRTRELFETFQRLAVGLTQAVESGEDGQCCKDVAGLMGSGSLGLTQTDGWFLGDAAKSIVGPAHFMPSLLGSKADHLWSALDTACAIDAHTRRLRYYDGYHFLACLNDLRVQGKDTAPQVPADVMEVVLELFVSSLEGILAQLAWCVEQCGQAEQAAAFRPRGVMVRPPEGFEAPAADQLGQLIQVKGGGAGWEVFVLGIPGEANKGKLCYHDRGKVKRLG